MIAPSILSCDFANMARDCREVVEAGAAWLHVDVMDGHFVPNITIGPCIVESLHKAMPNAFLDCHLMISEPQRWIEAFAHAGATQITFHFEALETMARQNAYLKRDIADINQCILDEQNDLCLKIVDKIHSWKMRAGVSIKPNTPTNAISDELLQHLDTFLVMSVEPGFGGQKYKPDCAKKCTDIKDRMLKIQQKLHPSNLENLECSDDFRESQKYEAKHSKICADKNHNDFWKKKSLIIEIDGGISAETAADAVKCGAEMLVAGSFVFAAEIGKRKEKIDLLLNACK